MAAWKERPRRFVEPPLVTHSECLAYRQSINKELRESSLQTQAAVDSLGPTNMSKHNTYLSYFAKKDTAPASSEHKWTYDRVRDEKTYDQDTPRDTYHAHHSESARKQCKVSLKTGWQVRSSQAYGWLPPLDEPTYGFGRSSIFMDSAMDNSHLRVGGPWTAR
mmetsp:Transcript_23441/g.42306  ORF Transcript_23441/g.42306 Transcript_23441/m.42306 type:complete len:163 (+) Transcript_23441:72-560(+)